MLESAKEQLKEVEPLKEQISQCGDKEIENLRESREISKRIEEHKAKLNEAKAARDALSAPYRCVEGGKRITQQARQASHANE